jgi:putative phosphoribosyl transferase
MLAATLLVRLELESEPVVLALPRGGVPVAFEVANAFKAPLDICLTQSLEVPGGSGLSMGALASGPVLVLQQAVIERFQIPEKVIARTVRREAHALGQRERAYRGERPAISLVDRTVILVDDGLVGVSSAVAAISAVRARRARRLILAMPVASRDACAYLCGLVDELVCLASPTPFQTVATWYQEFPQISDLDVRRLHGEAEQRAQHWSFPH